MKKTLFMGVFFGCRDPDRIQTCDPQLRRLLLYSAELPDHFLTGRKLSENFNPDKVLQALPMPREMFFLMKLFVQLIFPNSHLFV